MKISAGLCFLLLMFSPGIVLADATRVTVYAGVIAGNTADGIRLSGGANDNDILSNSIGAAGGNRTIGNGGARMWVKTVSGDLRLIRGREAGAGAA